MKINISEIRRGFSPNNFTEISYSVSFVSSYEG